MQKGRGKMTIEIKEIVDKQDKETIARDILNDLPKWFGMPESTQEYIDDSKDKPFIACFNENEAVDFIVLSDTSKDCAEILVMGLRSNTTEWDMVRG